MRNRLVIVLIGAASLALAQTAAGGKACTLLTKGEIQQALGGAIADGAPAKGASISDNCTYQAGGGASVMVVVSRSPANQQTGDAVEKFRLAMPEAKVSPVAGLGDAAVLIEHKALGTQISVFRGETNMVVQIFGKGRTAKVSAAVEALARKAVARL